jgi:MSHA biogenesis protein MshN
MSLINDMLRNLEAKRPDDLARQNLQREIRSLPAAASARGGALRWLLVLGLLAPVVVAGVLQANGRLLPLLGINAPPAVQPGVVASAPAVSPATAMETPAGPSGPVPAEPIAEPLRLASSLEFVPLPAVPVLVVPDPVALPVSVPSAATPVAEAPRVAPAAPIGLVKIEKSPVMATPRDRADAEYRRAEGALASGRTGEAVDGLRAALKHDPAYVPVRQMLLRQLLEMRKSDEAMVVLQEGLEVQPMQTGWAMSLARLQLEHNDLAAADRTLARSQAYGEANADYAGFQGHVKSRLGAPRQAVTHYQRAVRLAPGEGRWWLGLGLALEADGHAPEAKDAFKRSLATATLSAELAAVAEQHLH